MTVQEAMCPIRFRKRSRRIRFATDASCKPIGERACELAPNPNATDPMLRHCVDFLRTVLTRQILRWPTSARMCLATYLSRNWRIQVVSATPCSGSNLISRHPIKPREDAGRPAARGPANVRTLQWILASSDCFFPSYLDRLPTYGR